jgi:hypothetical protein
LKSRGEKEVKNERHKWRKKEGKALLEDSWRKREGKAIRVEV